MSSVLLILLYVLLPIAGLANIGYVVYRAIESWIRKRPDHIKPLINMVFKAIAGAALVMYIILITLWVLSWSSQDYSRDEAAIDRV